MGYPIRTGVYIIQSISHPERVYVGSALRIDERWGNHRRELKKGKHHSSKLQNHYNKYGLDDLVFETLEDGDYINKSHLLAREQGWFDHFATKETKIPYFNINPFADSCAGVKRSPESIEKRVNKMKGKKRTTPIWNEGKAGTYKVPNISKALKGNQYAKGKTWTLSEDIRKEKSERMKNSPHHNRGKKLPKETTDKMSLSRIGNKNNLGNKASKETILKLKEVHKKENLSSETLEKMRVAQLGKTQSEETKKKKLDSFNKTIKNRKIAKIISALLNKDSSG